ncbi:MAG: hypothetical protein OXU73_00020, partial [Candidatus Campbellbacteria bacterium]|nr:hypothetical protein [Candidatus Campbellbacteria bacterium]
MIFVFVAFFIFVGIVGLVGIVGVELHSSGSTAEVQAQTTPTPTITSISVCGEGIIGPWSDICPRVTNGGSTSNNKIAYILGCRPGRATSNLSVYINDVSVPDTFSTGFSNKNPFINEYACPSAGSVTGAGKGYHITLLRSWRTPRTPGTYKIQVAEPGSSQKSNAVTITIDKTAPTITGTVPPSTDNTLSVPITVTDNVGVRTTAKWFLHTTSACPTTESSYTNSFALLGGVASKTATITVAKQSAVRYLCVRATDTANPANVSHVYLGQVPVRSYGTTTPITGFDRPQGIAIRGNYAYVVNRNDTLSIINISNPTSPTVVSSPSITGFDRPYGIAIKGNYAYVVNRRGNTLSILNLTNATSPTAVSSPSITGFSNPQGIAIRGSYAYVVNRRSNTLSILNLSNATSPTVVSSPSIAGFNSPYGIAIRGNYAYVTNINNTLSILNLTNATSPTVVSSPSIAGFNRPHGIAVKEGSGYAYVVNRGSDRLSIINISDNTIASRDVATTPAPTNLFNSPQGIAISGNNAYITNNNNTFSVVDISTFTTPTLPIIDTPPPAPTPPPTPPPTQTAPTITAIGVCGSGNAAPWNNNCG